MAPGAETKLPRQAHVFEEQRGCPGTEAAESTAWRWQEQSLLEQALLTCPGTFLCSHRMVENLGFPAVSQSWRCCSRVRNERAAWGPFPGFDSRGMQPAGSRSAQPRGSKLDDLQMDDLRWLFKNY